MKKRYYFYFLMLISILHSCETTEENKYIETLSGYQIENGYIRFRDFNEYKKAYEMLSNFTKEELSNWRKKAGINTLEMKYQAEGVEFYKQTLDENGDFNSSINTQRLNPVLASLFNENGVLVISDEIWKVKDDLLFVLNKSDSAILRMVDNGQKLVNDKVIQMKHTISVNPKISNEFEGMLKSVSDRTLMFYTSSTTREAVRFEAYLSGGFIRFEMNGRYQKKGILGYILSQSSSMVYGRINATGTVGAHSINTTNPFLYDIETVFLQYYVGLNPSEPFNLNLTYDYKKSNSTAYINEWQGVLHSTAGIFTRNYDYREF
jgi:hypothetical protein